MKQAFWLPLLLLFALPAFGAQDGTFIYSKTILRIIPKAEILEMQPAQAQPAPAKSGDQKKDSVAGALGPDALMPSLKRAPKEFTVEVRLQSFLEQTDFIARQPFTDKEGMLILIDPPAEAQLKGTHMIASADVLFVDPDGLIVKIAPQLNLSKLTETIDSGRPIHAFVYLKSGAAAANDIQLGDHIENTYFQTHPVVIQ